jgi:hypothetical protein
MTKRLNFGSGMLALFLKAHVVYAGVVGASLPLDQRRLDEPRRAAEQDEERRLAKLAGVSLACFRRAMRGDIRISQDERIALWMAMEIDPYIHQRRAA